MPLALACLGLAVLAGLFALGGGAQAAEQQAMLTPSDPGDNDFFGTAMDLDGDTLAVGASGHAQGTDDSRADRGAAYVFTRDGGWTEQVQLTQLEANDGDEFGAAVAVDGDTIAIGAPGTDSSSGLAGDYGAVYVFRGGGDGYDLEGVLQPEDTFDDQAVGAAVAVDGDTLLAGAPGIQEDGGGFDYTDGSVLVWERSGGSWSMAEEIRSPVESYEAFGTTVAFDGETALVGAPGTGGSASFNPGTVYAYAASDGWSQTAEVDPEDGGSGGRFGAALAFHEDAFVAGAPSTDLDGDGEEHGAAYAFERGSTGWTQVADLTPETIDGFSRFGSGVALSADAAIVGARGNDTAYQVSRSDGSWSEPDVFSPDGDVSDVNFGSTALLSGDTSLVGAPNHDGDGSRRGAVYAFAPAAADDDGGDGAGNGGDVGSEASDGSQIPGPGALTALAAALTGASLVGRRR